MTAAEYFLAPSLVALRRELNALFPRRDRRSDGWVGDASHQARVSDHNPDWDAPGARRGVVRALDVDVNDNDEARDLRAELLAATVGDVRVWYVISRRVIRSRTYDWEPRRYLGANPHEAHVHVSLRHLEDAESDTSSWLEPASSHVRDTTLSRAALVYATLNDRMSGEWARDRAQLLAWAHVTGAITRDELLLPYRRPVDWSTVVANAVRAVERRRGLPPTGRVSDTLLDALRADGYVITS